MSRSIEDQNPELSSVEKKVRDVICHELAVKADLVTPSASFTEDLAADSLDVVELVMALEAEFDLDIPEEPAEKIKTVGDLSQFISKNVAKNMERAARAG